MYHLRLHRGELLVAVLLPVAFNLLMLLALDDLVLLWRDLLEFWVVRLDFGSSVVMRPFDLGLYDLWLPTVEVEGPLPSAALWWSTTGICLAIFFMTYLIPPDRGLPVIYILRAILLLQGSALLYFAFMPASFPYRLEDYVSNSLFAGIVLLWLVPWILGATYYVFDFSLIQKIVLTFTILAFFLVALPLQYLLHANIIALGSLLFMPVLYLVFGLFLDIMAFVALYAFGMSWRIKKPEEF